VRKANTGSRTEATEARIADAKAKIEAAKADGSMTVEEIAEKEAKIA